MRPTLHRALWILLSLCAIPLVCTAQSSSNLGHQAWSTENGLPQNSVHAIFQSRDGYLWIATEGGVALFNGVDFKVFQHENTPAITSDDICCFAQSSDGNGTDTVWIGTSDGLLRYDSGSFRRYTTADGLPSQDVLAVIADNSSIYVLTGGGLARFDGKVFVPISLSSPPLAIASYFGDGLLIATSSGLLQYRQGGAERSYVQLAPSVEMVQAFGNLSDHTLWQRTRFALTFTANGNSRTIDSRFLGGARIESFLQGSRGTLWIGTNKGLYRLDDSASMPQLQPELSGESILSLLQDSESNLWVGTETSGLHLLRHRNFTTLPALADRMITAVTQTEDSAMWLGSNGDGIDRWLNGSIHHLSTRDGLLSDVILSLAPGSDGGLWIGTPDGLNHVQGTHIESYTSADGLPDDFVRSLLLDNDDTLWIGTRRGVARLRDHTFTTFSRSNGLRSDLVGAMLQPAGTDDLWIATLDGLSLMHNGSIKTFTTADGLSGNVITSLFEDSSGNLWIGTRGDGLSLRTPNRRFVALNRKDLPQTVDSIVGDNAGSLWLGFSRGIVRAPILELLACASSPACNLHLNHYGTSEGMPTEEISAIGHPAAWQTSDGSLWFGTRKGVAIVDPAHLFVNRVPPPVAIERFTVGDVEQHNGARIPPGQTRFAFEYAGLSFLAPSRVRYRYRLEGFDKQWTDAGGRRTAFYTNLPPGSYRFHVQAANNDGLWNEAGAEISFTVSPPFYRTAWFLLLVLAAIASMVVLLYRLRLRRLQSRFAAVLAERTRVAREIHDTLAQSFVGVSVQLELATQLLAHHQVDAARQQLDRTSAYVREGIAEARRSIWDLRAATAQNTLPTRLSRLAEQFGADGLTLRINIGGTYRPIDASSESEVLRIAQESLTNVKRHAEAKAASLDLRYEPAQLTLTVKDDGLGFSSNDADAAPGHFGLQGMRERAAQIGATLTVISAPGQGTRITLNLPLAPEKGTHLHV
jgi:signal transduction histidine kinase/ligand-binding sensor domain-containing protein